MNADSMSPGPWSLSSLQVHTRSGEDAEATVVAANDRGGIILDRTIFYPTSGGQPGDAGTVYAATQAGPYRSTDGGSTWIDLVCNDSAGFERYYAAAETDIKRNGLRPHLGKYCESIDRSDLERLHRESFVKFHQLVDKHDPEGKFANAFTQQLFGVDS